MSKRHMAKYEEARLFEVATELYASYGKGSNKTLDVVTNIEGVRYEVTEGMKSVLQTTSLHDAVEAYNNLP